MTLTSRSAEETRRLGERLGRRMKGLDVLCLVGDLGSGKTTFTQGLALGAGFKGKVTSPTFVLAKLYKGKKLSLHHLDLYRIAAGALGDIGIEDYVSDPKAACVIEWPEAGGAYFPGDRLEVRFAHGRRKGERRLSMKAFGPRSRLLLGR